MAASQEKQMQVCEICGAFLILSDAQQRIDDHLTGKQHLGYAKLKDVVEEIRVSTAWAGSTWLWLCCPVCAFVVFSAGDGTSA